MDLIPWRATPELPHAFERLFGGFLGTPATQTGNGSTSWLPPLDVIETENAFTIRVELPGVDPKDVEITLQNSLLILSGEKKCPRGEKGKERTRTECAYGPFQRTLTLPEGVDAAKVTAEGAHGVLEIRIPKPEAATPRRIAVSFK